MQLRLLVMICSVTSGFIVFIMGIAAIAVFFRLFGVCRCTISFEELPLSSAATPSQSVN